MDATASAKSLYAAFNAHNIPGILDLLDEDVQWDAYGPDFALAIGFFKGKAGVTEFFAKLVGPNGQQSDVLFEPQEYFAGGGTVHVLGIEAGTLTKHVAGGAYAGKPFYNNFDHTLWFSKSGKISHFRANYQLALSGPTWKPLPPKHGSASKA